MQTLFIITSIVGMFYFTCKKRTFDFFSLAFFSACIYFLPGFYGYSLSPYDQVKIPLIDDVFIVMILVLLSILISTIISDSFQEKMLRKSTYTFKDYGLFLKFLIILSVTSFILMLATSGELLFSAQKSVVMDSLNRFHIIWVISTALWVIISFVEKRLLLFYIGLSFLLFDIFIGFRSTAAITIMAMITIHLNNQGKQVLIKKWRVILLGGFVSIFFFVYKKIYINVKLKRWDLIIEDLSDYSFYIESVTSSEPFTTQTILNNVLINDFHVGLQHLIGLIYQFIPINIITPTNTVSFNDLFQSELFPGLNFGMANNIWAEMYSSGGWLLLIVFIIFFNSAINIGNYFLMSKDNKIISTVSLVMVYWTFYIHRNSIIYEINLIKRILLVSFFVILFSSLIVSAIKKNVKAVSTANDR